jgi:membrane-associated phospholipid phosphatase
LADNQQPVPARKPSGVRGELHDDRFVGGHDLTRWKSRPGQLIARGAHHISRLLGPYAALVLTLALGLAIALTLTVASAEVYEAVQDSDDVAVLDQPLLNTVKALRSPALDTAVTGYTNIGGVYGMPILAVLTMAVLAFRRQSWTPVILVAAAGGGSLLMTISSKQLIGRHRPSLADAVPPYEYSASFPSGHTLNATVIAGIVAYLLILRQHTVLARTLTITAATVFAMSMGLSRVFLGHHWFTDVLVAWTLGLAWLALVITAHRLYLTARQRNTTPKNHP